MFYPVGGSPTSIAPTADFDGDGNLDLAFAVSSIDSVAVLYGNGDGTFRPAAISPVGANPDNTAQTADVNGDGRPDIAVPLPGENRVAVLLNATRVVTGAVVTYTAVAGRLPFSPARPGDEDAAPAGGDGTSRAGQVRQQGVADLLVILRNGERVHKRATDSSGRFRLGGLPPGRWVITVDEAGLPAGYPSENKQIVVETKPGAQADIEFRLVPKVRTIRMLKSPNAIK